MSEVKVKTIEVNYTLCSKGDPMDMITITRQQFREALSFCLVAFHRAGPGDMDEELNDRLTRICGTFAAGPEYKLFGEKDEEDEDGDHKGTV